MKKSNLVILSTVGVLASSTLVGIVKGFYKSKKTGDIIDRLSKTDSDIAEAKKDIEEIAGIVPELLDAKNTAEAEVEKLRCDLENSEESRKALQKEIEELKSNEEIEEEIESSEEYAENFTRIMNSPEIDEPNIDEAQEKIKATDLKTPRGKTTKARSVRNGSVKSVPKKNRSKKRSTEEVHTAYSDGSIGECIKIPDIKTENA